MKRGLSLALRALAIGLVLLSPWSPSASLSSDARSLVLVVDRSESISADDRARTNDLVGEVAAAEPAGHLELVELGATPKRVRTTGAQTSVVLPATTTGALGSDLAGALRLAQATLPTHGERRIVLLTDGRATTPGALAEATRAHRAGVVVDTLGIAHSSTPSELSIATLEPVDAEVHQGETIAVVAKLRGRPHQRIKAHWRRNGAVERTESLSIDGEGELTLRLDEEADHPGTRVYELSIEAEDKARSAIDSKTLRRTAVLVSGKPTVLVVSLSEEKPTLLMDALEQADVHVRSMTLSKLAIDDEALSASDLVVLADLPIERPGRADLIPGLDTPSQEALIRYVRDHGGGLLVTGGASGFSPEYASAPLARMLPLQVRDQGEMEDPPVALAILLDRSGSMSVRIHEESEQTKIAMAVEASLASASVLRPKDRVGIAVVDEQAHWVQPLAPATAMVESHERIRATEANGGGIYVYTGLADAYAKLSKAREGVRHVILFSDAADSEEQRSGCPFGHCAGRGESAVDLAMTARAAGITTTVVGIGSRSDVDAPFLETLAAAGGGRFYITEKASDLRRIFVGETRAVSRSNLREEATPVRRGDRSKVTEGLDVAALPALSGFVETTRRGTADTAIETGDGHPILASWRYGLGKVVALTSDAAGRWSSAWGASDEAARLFRQIVRASIRGHAPNAADAELSIEGKRIELEVRVADDLDPERAPADLELFSVRYDGRMERVDATLERVAGGRYRAVGEGSGESMAVARIRDGRGHLVAQAIGTQRHANELAQLGNDERALDELARAGGGKRDPSAEEMWSPTGIARNRRVPSWPWLLIAAAALVVLDLWLRRLGPRSAQTSPSRLAIENEMSAPEASETPNRGDVKRAA